MADWLTDEGQFKYSHFHFVKWIGSNSECILYFCWFHITHLSALPFLCENVSGCSSGTTCPLCSNSGVCGDPPSGSPSPWGCTCDHGYTGTICETEDKTATTVGRKISKFCQRKFNIHDFNRIVIYYKDRIMSIKEIFYLLKYFLIMNFLFSVFNSCVFTDVWLFTQIIWYHVII